MSSHPESYANTISLALPDYLTTYSADERGEIFFLPV